MSIINPDKDAPVDHMKLHKDLSLVIKTVWGIAIVGFLAGVWATTLAGDVEENARDIKEKATVEQLHSVVETLTRIEGKIDEQRTEQKVVSDTVIRLETKVEALENRAD